MSGLLFDMVKYGITFVPEKKQKTFRHFDLLFCGIYVLHQLKPMQNYDSRRSRLCRKIQEHKIHCFMSSDFPTAKKSHCT